VHFTFVFSHFSSVLLVFIGPLMVKVNFMGM